MRVPPAPLPQPRARKERAAAPATPVEPPPPARRFPVRLRHVLGVVAVGLGLRAAVPRAVAHWQLQDAAAKVANYGACMVGPSGPGLLLEQPDAFMELARRRLITSPPDARPFAACAPALTALGGADPERQKAHQAAAQHFAEYASLRTKVRGNRSLAELTVDLDPLRELAEAAWPFHRHGLAELLRPERAAKVSPEPIELPRAGLGRGLPRADVGYATLTSRGEQYLLLAGRDANLRAYGSGDGGWTWASVDSRALDLDGGAGRCSVGASRTSFRLGVTEAQLRLETWVDGAPEASVPLASVDAMLRGFSCDAKAALAVVEDPREPVSSLVLCPGRARCRVLSVPPELGPSRDPNAVVSAVRARGATVVSMALGGIVRVISSRDDGDTWTPAVVAYDARSQSGLVARLEPPTRLLALDGRVILYAGSEQPAGDYLALVSDDFGASWHGRPMLVRP